MKPYKVFPDHLASGVWEYGGANVDYELLKEVPEELLVALKLWCDIWEFLLEEGKMSDSYRQQWVEDGKTIVNAMNKSQQSYYFNLFTNLL
jgi:hypothetical protein